MVKQAFELIKNSAVAWRIQEILSLRFNQFAKAFLVAAPRKAVIFGLGPEWLILKRKSRECCG
jgi:hypothetical protein